MTSKKHKKVAEGRAAADKAFETLCQDVGVSSGGNNEDDEEEEDMRTVPDTPKHRVKGSSAATSPQQRVGGAPGKREASKMAPDPSTSTPLPKLSFHSSHQCLGSQALYAKGSLHIESPPAHRLGAALRTWRVRSSLRCWNQTSLATV
jgi:hypothetical protein